MAYIFYTLTFLFLIFATILYATRNIWKPHAPPIPYLTTPGPIPTTLYNLRDHLPHTLNPFSFTQAYTRLPTSTSFAADAEAGLHSANFNLAENIEAGDSRRGLDEEGRQEVYRVMKVRGVGFDEARRLVVEAKFGREGIGRDGRPLDRKAVMFS